LAYGCLQGDPLAVALLQERIVALGGPILRRLDPSPAFADEVRQHVVERLLLAGENGASPKLAAYAGRGTLDAWLRPVIRGLALNLRRVEAGRKPAGDEALVDKMADLADPEIEYLRSRYRDDLRAAFCESLKALTARERNLLRLSLLGGVSVRRLGGMYRVGHSTIARWLTEARAKILESTRCALGERLGLSRAEVDSLLRALRSQIDDWLSVHLN
ncbi:MAG: sigma-70 family RNA polymerase sigma factor, partial [Deltaproteobacteria bacterium]|nr:sigma-70 family RNA polymerase sigma factor [Deltaproteobacteria bacterium]